MSFSPQQVRQATQHLRTSDPVMRTLIDAVGPFTLKVVRGRFQMLVRSIISQQISTHAARSIRRRLEQFVAPGKPTAEKLARLDHGQLRSVGLSGQKAAYLLDLSQKVLDGDVRLHRIGRMTDEAVINELTQVKGIGVWTAQMFLMFCLGRLDIFPHDDLGIRKALHNLYNLDELPDKATSHEIAAAWRPYATIASWYCWRSHELDDFAPNRPTEFPV